MEHAVEFILKNTSWLERQLSSRQADWADGTEIWFRGERVALRVDRNETGFRACFAGVQIAIASLHELRIAIETHLREMATVELMQRALELAKTIGMEVQGISVRNQRTRWGSCSARNTISLNWRLIQTPEFVRDYIIFHELMHLKEMNHSARFWAHVAAVCPGYMEAERWLRKNSRLLR